MLTVPRVDQQCIVRGHPLCRPGPCRPQRAQRRGSAGRCDTFLPDEIMRSIFHTSRTLLHSRGVSRHRIHLRNASYSTYSSIHQRRHCYYENDWRGSRKLEQRARGTVFSRIDPFLWSFQPCCMGQRNGRCWSCWRRGLCVGDDVRARHHQHPLSIFVPTNHYAHQLLHSSSARTVKATTELTQKICLPSCTRDRTGGSRQRRLWPINIRS